MAITLTATSQRADAVRADLLVVPAGPDGPLGAAAAALTRALGPDIDAVTTVAGFEGKPGQTVLVATGGRLPAAAVLLVGVGEPAKVTVDGLRRAGAALARAASKVRTVATSLVDAAPKAIAPADAAQALAEGVLLGAYQFLEHKSQATATALRRVSVLDGRAEVRRGLDRGAAIGRAATHARDLVNEPAGSQSPAEFAAGARRYLARSGVTVQVLTEAQIRAQRMGGVIGVGQGSTRPPRFLKIAYVPARPAPGHLALVGKGVVFDSGGLSLKPPGGMETMKTDMSGAAAVVAAMSVLRAVGVRNRVTAYVPLVENMPSGTAIRPGDVLTFRNGKTVEVLNTDAEGRLILADALALAVDDKADAIVDLATLTGACVVALGEKIAGLMGNHDGWSDQVRAAADRAGESVWPLPLPSEYRKMLDSEVADLKNVSSGGYGGALTAGIFLQQFVGDRPWVHLDIAGPSRAPSDDGYLTKGGTGFGVRTLVELVAGFTVPEGPVNEAAAANGAKKPTARRKPAAKKAAAKSTAAKKTTTRSGRR
ncbi:MAG: leucyl aminopeptidase [Acidimicrobiia bacterium]